MGEQAAGRGAGGMKASRPRRTAAGFSPAEDAEIRQGVADGWSSGRIARSIRRNPSSVHARGVALGLRWRSPPPRPNPPRCSGRQLRSCLTCSGSFRSDGPGNRMCAGCRLAASEMSPFEP